MSAVEKVRLRLPRMRKPSNPFKAGTSSIKRRAGRAAKLMGGASAFLAATPGTGYAGGAIGAAVGGPQGAAAGFGAGAAIDYAATAGLGLAARRRQKLGRYLARRSKRKSGPSGVYKTMEHGMGVIDGLYCEIEKARGGARSGMIPYGSRHQYGRAKFFEARAKRWGEDRTPLAQRGSRARAYLANRYRGGKGPGGRIRTGNGGIYKSEQVMDAIETLDEAIEKAGGFLHGIAATRRLSSDRARVARLKRRVAGLRQRAAALGVQLKPKKPKQ